MKFRYSIIGLLVLVLLVPSALAAVLTENFEDDIIGQNPSEGWYVYTEFEGTPSNDVQNIGNPGQGLELDRPTTTDFSRNWVSFEVANLCQAGASVKFDARWQAGQNAYGFGLWESKYQGNDFFSGGFGPRFGLDNAGQGYVWGFTGSGNSGLTGVGGLEGGWHTYEIYNINCSQASATFRVDGGTAYFEDAPGSWSSLTYLQWGGNAYGNGDHVRVDNVEVNIPGELAEIPTGLRGEVVKLGSISTTGQVELSWNLASNDPNQDVGSFDYKIYVDGAFVATDSVDGNDGGGVRNYVYPFTGSASYGPTDFQVSAVADFESGLSCTVNLDLDVLGASGDCGLSVALPAGEPTEFDRGFSETITAFGFASSESKVLFSLILVGGIHVATGVSAKFMAAGRFKNYMIHGAGAIIGAFTVVVGWLDLWMWLIAFMLGTFAVRGSGEVRNTWLQVQAAIRDRNRPRAFDAEGNEMDFNGDGVNLERFEASAKALESARKEKEALDLDDLPVQPITGAKVAKTADGGTLVVDPGDKTGDN